jgi:hypothetical protein
MFRKVFVSVVDKPIPKAPKNPHDLAILDFKCLTHVSNHVIEGQMFVTGFKPSHL